MSTKHNYKRPTKIAQTKLFINNEFVEGVKKQHISVINPATEEEICKVSEATKEDIELAVEAAEKAFPVWRDTPTR